MRLKDGDPFDIEGDDGEVITFVMTDGTVDEVITNLDGVQEVLQKGETRKFNLSQGQKRRMLVTYIFKANSGESFESHVTGKAGGQESVDMFQQVPGMADKSRLYFFEA